MTDIQKSFFFFLPPPEGGGARVPCQISDLAGWEREGEFLRNFTLTLTLSRQGRGKRKRVQGEGKNIGRDFSYQG